MEVRKSYQVPNNNLFDIVCIQGNSDIDQLGKIFAAFGTPKPTQWPDMIYLPDFVEYQYVPGQPLRTLFTMASDDALDLLSKMFVYDPKSRISTQQALEHRYCHTPTVEFRLLIETLDV